MDYKTGRPNHIEDYLVQLHIGQWFGWSDSKNKVYANLIIHLKIQDENNDTVDNPYSKPTEQECIDGLAQLQTDFDDRKTKQETDKASGNQKLKDLGLTDDEITAITKG
jgi:hypothetical protein